MKQKLISEIIGWIGAFLILFAYGLLSFNLISSGNVFFQLLNCIGAFGVAYVSLKKKAYQPGALNMVWALIALFAIFRILF